MARTSQDPLRGVSDFDIVHPGIDEAVSLLSGCTVAVTVTDNGNHDSFLAKVVDSCDESVPSTANTFNLTNTPGTNTWTGSVPAGFLDPFDILECTKQIVVFGVIAGENPFPKLNPFRITKGGSVTCSASGSQRSCDNCSAQPVPVCLLLQNSGGAIINQQCAQCGLLNDNFLLQHSDDPCFCCCWFSDPIEFCGANPGYWKLEKTNATTWVLLLLLSQPDGPPQQYAGYSATTDAGVCTFPVTLTRVTEVVDGCSNYPDTITIANAP